MDVTEGSDTAEIDYMSLAFSVAMVVLGIFVGFTASYLNNMTMKKILGGLGLIATCYMIYTALFGNATGSAPIWELPMEIWLAPLCLCSIAWTLSFVISTIFKLPKKSVLTVCLESSNQNSILSAAIIYLSLDEYSDADIDLAIGIPIMYTIICIVFDALMGFMALQLHIVNCKTPDDPDYDEGDVEDDTVTLVHFVYKYKQWRQNKNDKKLLHEFEADTDYGTGSITMSGMTMERAAYKHSDDKDQSSSTLDSEGSQQLL